MLHPDFIPATWRGTTNTDGEVVGVSFGGADGSIVRLALDLDCARRLAESILEYADAYRRMNLHSDRSSGSLNLDGFPQLGQKV